MEFSIDDDAKIHIEIDYYFILSSCYLDSNKAVKITFLLAILCPFRN